MPTSELVYVMRKKSIEDCSFELWDPLTGQCYFFENEKDQKRKFLCIPLKSQSHMQVRWEDPICPMTQIHCIVSSENVWCNIQKVDYPIMMDFDFSSSKKWKKFFSTDKVQDPFILQKRELLYSAPKQHT